ncbi:unnamed protein product [Acanthoscelides obtectus]|uniref:Uncharacterized protein n=1 Tax=Acanthoscelides obtectus TaxID=200917 RepID=A0A9P0QCZ9_ACAOB|nr:unnamed protein product [Acanthoscelides obtectus]CAK1682742.1 hypothetical protein AOBTE_LOCUS33844 [Acanthoscelides obtectus]
MRRDPSIGKPQVVRDSSPAERSISNHEMNNAYANGNVVLCLKHIMLTCHENILKFRHLARWYRVRHHRRW